MRGAYASCAIEGDCDRSRDEADNQRANRRRRRRPLVDARQHCREDHNGDEERGRGDARVPNGRGAGEHGEIGREEHQAAGHGRAGRRYVAVAGGLVRRAPEERRDPRGRESRDGCPGGVQCRRRCPAGDNPSSGRVEVTLPGRAQPAQRPERGDDARSQRNGDPGSDEQGAGGARSGPPGCGDHRTEPDGDGAEHGRNEQQPVRVDGAPPGHEQRTEQRADCERGQRSGSSRSANAHDGGHARRQGGDEHHGRGSERVREHACVADGDHRCDCGGGPHERGFD